MSEAEQIKQTTSGPAHETSLSPWDGTGTDPASDPPDAIDAWDSAPAAPVASRPKIRVQAGYLDQQATLALEAIVRADSNLYQRSGQLVTIVREPLRTEGGPICENRASLSEACTTCGSSQSSPCVRAARKGVNVLTRPGTPKMIAMGPSGLTRRASRYIHWERFDARRGKGKAGEREGDWVECNPCKETLAVMSAPEEGYPGVKPIRGILETPCLGPSGRVIQAPGYDEETGYVLLPSVDIGKTIDLPTQENARAALQYLWTEIACDFPFRGLGEPDHEHDPTRVLQYSKALDIPDAFVGIAMLLTIFARPAILGAIPAGLFEAAGQGSGKSLQIHTIAMVATSRAASVATFPMRDGRPDEAELEKIIMGYALAGARIISFDNIRGFLAGATIERAMTAVDTIEGRVLGHNDQRSLPWAAAMLFSGNNMVMSDDVAQRSLACRVESPREDPRARPAGSFRHTDLLAAIKARRSRLVRAVLVILRAYLAAKNSGLDVPDPGTRGSFEAWSRIVPGALMWAGGPNIIRAFPEGGRGGDEEGDAHASLLRLWRDDWQGQRASVILEAIFKREEQAKRDARHGIPTEPDGLEDARGAIRLLMKLREGAAPNPAAFGAKLYALRGKIRDGRRIEHEKDKGDKMQRYWVREAKR